jgi:hypothetical protein
MATERCVFSAIGIVNNGTIKKKKHCAESWNCSVFVLSVYSNAESSNTEYMLYSKKFFGRMVNKKCLVIETYSLLSTS